MRSPSLFSRMILLVLLGPLLGCVPSDEVAEDDAPVGEAYPAQEVEPVTRAIATLHPTEGNNTTGVVHFVSSEEGIQVMADVEGLAPGLHGFHVHAYGDCSAPDGTSAGGHFNPEDMPHGAPTDDERHVGDLGNLSADETGVAHLEWTDPLLSFTGAHSIIGRAVIVHGQEDDYTTQPTGAAGPRLACGVIGIDEG